MRTMTFRMIATFLALALVAPGQQNQSTILTSTVPRLVRISNTFRPADGQAASLVESVTLSIYRDEQGGAPLWQETQNVSVDSEGKYNLLMGSTANEGVPVDLFSSSEPRWLGVKFNRGAEVEQPRIRLASVPYALKASDAETLGGRPASAYLLAGPAETTTLSGTAATGPGAKAVAKPKAISGMQGYIPVFTDSSNDLGDSVMQQANGNIGIETVPGAGAASTPSLDLRTYPFSQIGMGQTTDYLTFFASDTYGPAIYWDPAKDLRFGKGGAGLYNPFGFTEQMRIQSSTGNVGIGVAPPGAKLDVAGSINFSGALSYQGTPVFQLSSGGSGGNLAVGLAALIGASGTGNVAVGNGALQQNTSGYSNTATGSGALQSNVSGYFNTAIGFEALASNNSSYSNTATGFQALANSSGGFNTANGAQALVYNTTGYENTAIGTTALGSNTTGNTNTAAGTFAMNLNTTGSSNTALGEDTLYANTTGNYNTAVGMAALSSEATGYGNTAIGVDALNNISGGNNNIAIGICAGCGVQGSNSNNIDIGSPGLSTDNGVIRIGAPGEQTQFFVVGVANATVSGVPVLVDTTSGQLGVASSSRRFKEDIQDMGTASDGLMRLRPVTFRYKQPFDDGTKPIQYGLIAEEVDEVYPELVAQSADGEIETVKYQVLAPMLLNEVQKQRGEIKSLREQLQDQHRENQFLQERLAKIEALLASSASAGQ